MSRYKINILTLKGVQLIFRISEYTITDGNFIEFTDERTGKVLSFHASNCEIEEIEK